METLAFATMAAIGLPLALEIHHHWIYTRKGEDLRVVQEEFTAKEVK